MAVLAEAGADILACESIPSLVEGEVLLELLVAYSHLPCWISFTCRDARHVSHGEPVAACLSMAADFPHVLTGVNCLHPRLVTPLMTAVLDSGGTAAQVVYANRGDTWIDRKPHLGHRARVWTTKPMLRALWIGHNWEPF